MTLKPILLRMPDELVAQIDAARGDVPRSVFIRRCCERAVAPGYVTPAFQEVREKMIEDYTKPRELPGVTSGPVKPAYGSRLKNR